MLTPRFSSVDVLDPQLVEVADELAAFEKSVVTFYLREGKQVVGLLKVVLRVRPMASLETFDEEGRLVETTSRDQPNELVIEEFWMRMEGGIRSAQAPRCLDASAWLDVRREAASRVTFATPGQAVRLGALESLGAAGDSEALEMLGATIVEGDGRRRERITDDLLREVATIYREAVKRGLDPTREVAERKLKGRSTAARWVGLARKRGFLGPATKGRAGEASAETRSA